MVNPINVMLTADEVRFIARDCRTTVLFAAADKLAGLADLVAEVDSLRTVVCFDGSPPGAESFAEYVSGDGTA